MAPWPRLHRPMLVSPSSPCCTAAQPTMASTRACAPPASRLCSRPGARPRAPPLPPPLHTAARPQSGPAARLKHAQPATILAAAAASSNPLFARFEALVPPDPFTVAAREPTSAALAYLLQAVATQLLLPLLGLWAAQRWLRGVEKRTTKV